MSLWGEIFLGVIAVATLSTALTQVALLIAAGRLARRVEQVANQIEQEIKPAFAHFNAIARDAARAASLATVQVERVDRLFGDIAQRVEQTMGAFHEVVVGPLRQGGAVTAAMAAFKAVLGVVRDARAGRARSRRDDEDALFI